MTTRLTCPQGHEWEQAFAGQSRTKETRAQCPVCGTAVSLGGDAVQKVLPVKTVALAAPARRPWPTLIVAGVSLAVVLILVVVGIIFVRQVREERDSARQERAEAERVRDLAERQKTEAEQALAAALKNYSLARETLENYLTRVSDNLHLRQDDLRPLRTELLDTIAPFYEKVALQSGDQAEQARAYARLAGLAKELGDFNKALERYRQGLALFEMLSQARPEVADYRSGMGNIHNELVSLHHAQDHADKAEESYQRGLAVWRYLIDKYPDEGIYQVKLADLQANLAAVYLTTRRGGQAEALVEQTRSTRERLARRLPQYPEITHNLAKDYATLGHLHWQAGRRDNAQAAFEEGIKLLTSLTSAHPHVAAYQLSLVIAHDSLGSFFNSTGTAESAQPILTQGLKVAEALAGNHPAVAEYQLQVASLQANLAGSYKETNRRPQAQTAFGEAIKIRERLSLLYPQWIDLSATLGGNYCTLGNFFMETNRAEAALPWYDRAANTLKTARERAPSHAAAREFLRNTHYGKGNALTFLKRYVDASKEYDAALELADSKTRDFLTAEYAGACCNAGNELLHSGKTKDAVPWYDHAVEALDEVVRRDASQARAVEVLANSLIGRAMAQHFLNSFNKAKLDWDRAIELNGEKNPIWRLGRAETLARLGRHEDATADAEKVAAIKKLSPGNFYDLARVHALCLKVTKNPELTVKYSARSVELLRQAIAAGFDDLERLRKNPELDPLRDRDDFQRLITDLDAKLKAGGQ